MSDHGKFVWHDLMTSDLKGSARFYSELFGWKISGDEVAKGEYVHIQTANGQHIGGMLPMAMMQMKGVPPHWLPYIGADDAEASVKRATAAGARVHMPIRDIEVGRFAVLGDPQGAAIATFQYTKTKEEPKAATPGMPAPGTFCWDELWTTDPEGAKKFYTQWFNWGVKPMDMGGMGTYHLFQRAGEQQAGGMMKLDPHMPQHPFWLSYVAVADTDKTAEHVGKLSGRTIVPPQNIPNVGRFSVFMDAQGAALGVLGPNK